MWRALKHAQLPVAPGGKLFIAIYNDMGSKSTRWNWIKKAYNDLPRFLKAPFAAAVMAPEEMKAMLRSLVLLNPAEYVHRWTQYDKNRGMSPGAILSIGWAAILTRWPSRKKSSISIARRVYLDEDQVRRCGPGLQRVCIRPRPRPQRLSF
jgi:hypothetical protein